MAFKKNTPGCATCSKCPCADVTVTVRGCSGTVQGATVDLVLSGSTVASGTTNSSGVVVLGFPSTGSYTINASHPDWTSGTTSKSLTCPTDNTASVTLTAPTSHECFCVGRTPSGCPDGAYIPDTMTLTDSFGSVTLTKTFIVPGTPTWVGCAMRAATSCTVPIQFRFECNGLGLAALNLFHNTTCAGNVGKDCTTLPTFNSSPGNTAAPSSCSPFSASITINFIVGTFIRQIYGASSNFTVSE